MLSKFSKVGITSDVCYAAGFASIALSFASHFISREGADDSKPQADRWGLFVGEWAPTFFALGVALKLEESTTVQ
ncbi:hypothetical protein [Kytococcus sedentarius]|uniref:hypothetical protein n=1 Tax=Kytococcus sedentarius TaxID=1276 RepID=UPI00194E5873|nr:hypothetical protein [Kytococcus sedentarius]QRO88069.1 hypothetical protein I6J30_03720 [Kytococcus sedentarius]